MALFTKAQLREVAHGRVKESVFRTDAQTMLVEKVQASAKEPSFDIFLSHSIKDAELILGITELLETLEYTVYVDWLDDPKLDRKNVSPATANTLRRRMQKCKSLFYVTTDNAATSKWMPWECGYFDGLKEKVAIVPVVESSDDDSYSGQEYLGLYPYCLQARNTSKKNQLWIHRDEDHYRSYDYWVKTKNSVLTWRTNDSS